MLRMTNGLYLEPGEVAVLVDAARRAVPTGPARHPRELMLAAAADALAEVVEGDGVLVARAPAGVARRAAQAMVRSADRGRGERAAVSGEEAG